MIMAICSVQNIARHQLTAVLQLICIKQGHHSPQTGLMNESLCESLQPDSAMVATSLRQAPGALQPLSMCLPGHFVLHQCFHNLVGIGFLPPRSRQDLQRSERIEKAQAASIKKVKGCCTLQELQLVAAQQQTDVPALVTQAAAQVSHVVQLPLRVEDRQLMSSILGALITKCAGKIEEYEVEELAILVGACARVCYVPNELLLPLQLRLSADTRRRGLADAAPHLSALASHLSHLSAKSPRLWQTIGEAGLSCLGQASCSDVAGLLAAHSRVGVANQRLFEQAVLRFNDIMNTAKPQDVATLVWALARAGHVCPRVLVRAIASHISFHASEYGTMQLATVAGACAKLNVSDKKLHALLTQRGVESLREETNAWVVLPSRFGGNVGEPPLTSEAVSVLVTGLKRMSHADPSLLRAASALLIKMKYDVSTGAARPGPDTGHIEQMASALLETGLLQERDHLLSVFCD